MGSDKALLELEGKTLLQHAVDLCEPLCQRILISSNNPNHSLGKYLVVPDEFPDSGPMSGIYSALLKSDTDWNFVVSVDTPFVNAELVSLMWSRTMNCEAVVPTHSGKLEPLLAFYNRIVIPRFKNRLQKGRLKMHDLIAETDSCIIDVSGYEIQNPGFFRNLNRPEDF